MSLIVGSDTANLLLNTVQRLTTLENRVNKIINEDANLEGRVENLETGLSSLSNVVDTQGQSITQLNTGLSNLTNTVTSVNNVVQQSVVDIQALQSTTVGLSTSVNSLNIAMQMVNSRCQNLEIDVENIKKYTPYTGYFGMSSDQAYGNLTDTGFSNNLIRMYDQIGLYQITNDVYKSWILAPYSGLYQFRFNAIYTNAGANATIRLGYQINNGGITWCHYFSSYAELACASLTIVFFMTEGDSFIPLFSGRNTTGLLSGQSSLQLTCMRRLFTPVKQENFQLSNNVTEDDQTLKNSQDE